MHVSVSSVLTIVSSAISLCALLSLRLTKVFTIHPPKTAVMSAAMGRMTANGTPMRLNVAIMESMPVCGVAMRNDVTAPLDAPSFLNDMAVGITPHEQRGRGMPNMAALMTDPRVGFER